MRVFDGLDDPLPPKPTGDIRLVVLSDTHGRHHQLPPLPDGDILLHLGDAANRGSLADLQSFAAWLKRQRHSTKIVIEGNHDRDKLHPERIDLERVYNSTGILLRDKVVNMYDGKLLILGVSWSACEADNYIEAIAAAASGDNSRGDIDLLLTHRNPFYSRNDGHGWQGSKRISRLMIDLEVPLHLFGHVHWGRGVRTGVGAHNGIMVNCATILNRPVVIDWDPIKRVPSMIHCPIP